MKGKRLLIISLIFTLLFPLWVPTSTHAAEQPSNPWISVKLMKNIGNSPSLSIDLTGKFQLAENGQAVGTTSLRIQSDQNQLVLFKESEAIFKGSSLTFVPDTYGVDQIIKVNGQPYLGEMKFTLENGLFIRPINKLPLEDYLKGVVPYEMPASWELEALKAQAIAARTYAVRRANQVIDDTVNFQVYNGYKWSEKTTRAIEETKGQVLLQKDALIDALYSSSNGGMVEASGNVWNPTSYLVAQADPFDPQNQWNLSLKKVQISLEGKDVQQPELWWNAVKEADPVISASIKAWLQQHGYENQDLKILQITNLSIDPERTTGNRIKKGHISLDFIVKTPGQGSQVIHRDFNDVEASSLRQMLGGGNVFKSYLVDSVTLEGDSWTIRGKGYGHGVGMSQYGANEMAKKAKTARDIVAFYYPGTTLTAVGKVDGPTGPATPSKPLSPATPSPGIPITPPVKPGNSVQAEQGALISNLSLSSPTFVVGSKGSVNIQYNLTKPAKVTVRAYDEKGTIRRVILDTNQGAGSKKVPWDGYGMTAGSYTIVVEAKDENGVTTTLTGKIEFTDKLASRGTSLSLNGTIKSTVAVGLRPQPSFNTKPTQVLKNGDKILVVGKNDRWLQIKVGAATGYVPDNYIQFAK